MMDKKEEVTTMERHAAEDEWTDRPENNLRDNTNGPTALSFGQIEPTPTQQSDANVDPLHTHMPLRHLRGRKKEPPQDLNIFSRAAGDGANQHSPRPIQARNAGRDKKGKGHITSTPLGSAPGAPTLEDRRGKSHKSRNGGATGATLVAPIRKIHSLYSSFFMVTLVV